MARGSAQANTAAQSAQQLSTNLQGNAAQLFSTLSPELEAEAAHPAGFNPSDLAAMDTAAMESGGGSEAGAVGQGGLLAARTRNAGAPAAEIGAANREAGARVAKGALQSRLENARLKESQRRAALSGLEGLYAPTVGSSVGALGEVAQNVNANTNAENASWDWAKYLADPLISAASSSGNAYLRYG